MERAAAATERRQLGSSNGVIKSMEQAQSELVREKPAY
jgi:hypothetical protein